MKKTTKALLLVVCAMLLVAASVLGTLAYLTYTTGAVKNTFTVGSVIITLDEAMVTEYGDKVDGAARVTANKYKLIPGHEYTKDPTIHVDSNSENCWVFVKVENGLEGIIDATTIEDQMKANGWNVIDESNNIWAYNEIATKDDAGIPVFNSFKLTGEADVSAYDEAEISITGYAVQADGFDTAGAAWAATYGKPTT